MVFCLIGFWSFGCRRRQKNVVAAEVQLRHVTIEVDDGIGICGGIDALLLVEMVSFPVGELSTLGDALMEEVGPKLLEAEILDAHACSNMLEINVAGRVKTLVTMGKHSPIVVEGEADFEYGGIFQEIDETLGEAHEIEAEEEADSVAGNLKKCHLVLYAALEGRTSFGVDAEELEGAQIVYRTLGFTLALDDNDAAVESVAGQCWD